MGTSAIITIRSDGPELGLRYSRSMDGYPTAVMPDLMLMSHWIEQGRLRRDVGETGAWLVALGIRGIFDTGAVFRMPDHAPHPHDNKRNWPFEPGAATSFTGYKCGWYEPWPYPDLPMGYHYVFDVTANSIRPQVWRDRAWRDIQIWPSAYLGDRTLLEALELWAEDNDEVHILERLQASILARLGSEVPDTRADIRHRLSQIDLDLDRLRPMVVSLERELLPKYTLQPTEAPDWEQAANRYVAAALENTYLLKHLDGSPSDRAGWEFLEAARQLMWSGEFDTAYQQALEGLARQIARRADKDDRASR